MLAEIADFRWYVFSGGYKCVDGTSRGQKVRLVVPKWFGADAAEAAFTDEGDLRERYPLEDEPGLYRVFAGLALTEQAVLAFADAWGPLENAHEREPDETADTLSAYVSDSLEAWFTQIQRMKALVGLWDALQGAAGGALSDVIEVEADEQLASWWVDITFKEESSLRHGFHIREREWPDFPDLLEVGGKRELARMCLLELVNESLWGSCSPWLRPGEHPGEVTLCFTPHNLLAALWLSFAREILGEKRLKRCQHCKRHFEVSGEGGERRQRSDKKYCSPKCRAAAFKERHGDRG